ncbi:sulfatase-like hydrolase/transferase [Microbacterium oryzae]|uniref:sulfatase-like hydrolase/transferase n=1 Tax=Microbacterium oryzae TaxID=743009 RepID=UPI0025B1F6A5|nr:sulfatase-like hydrolase/transferase [Microbacterium oryzae]MDN3311591.1 sulfatase-like hydrolase/transferase [Microbacterium oryzae]
MTRDLILWILADELRADALSCYGTPHPAIRTPNIDRLARSGVLFDNAYTASPVCVPARVSMATGLRPDQSGVWGNEAYVPDYPLERGILTFTEHLADAGWRTASFGKEHVPPAMHPWQADDHAGSDMRELLEGAEAESVVRTPGLGFVVAGTWPSDRPYPPEAITAGTIAAMRDAEGPLLVRASYLQPHTPVIVPEPWASKYAGLPFPTAPRQDPADSGFERRFAEINRGAAMSPEEFRRAQVAYFGAVAWLDEQVRVLMQAIEEISELGRVTILLTADHGAHLGEDGAYGKHTFAPASSRIPLIVSGHGTGQGGIRRSDLASNADVARTLLAAAGVPAPASIGGRDLFADPEPEYLISGIGYGAAGSRAFPNLAAGTGQGGSGWPQRVCVRTARYRLDLTARLDGAGTDSGSHDAFLADRVIDPWERSNLIGVDAYEEIAERLTSVAHETSEQATLPSDDAVFAQFSAPGGMECRPD